MTFKRRERLEERRFVVRTFLGTRDLVNYNHMRLGFLSENVSPWHSIGPCCWRRRDLSKILLLSRRWNAFGLTKCSILFTLQPIAHILIIVLTVAILAQDLIAQPKAMVGWSNRSRAQSESKMDVLRVIRCNKGKTPPRSCWGDSAKFEFRSTGKQYTSKLPSPLSSF